MNGIVFLGLATALCCIAAGWIAFRRKADMDREKAKAARNHIRERYIPLKLDWSKAMEYTRIVPREDTKA